MLVAASPSSRLIEVQKQGPPLPLPRTALRQSPSRASPEDAGERGRFQERARRRLRRGRGGQDGKLVSDPAAGFLGGCDARPPAPAMCPLLSGVSPDFGRHRALALRVLEPH